MTGKWDKENGTSESRLRPSVVERARGASSPAFSHLARNRRRLVSIVFTYNPPRSSSLRFHEFCFFFCVTRETFLLFLFHSLPAMRTHFRNARARASAASPHLRVYTFGRKLTSGVRYFRLRRLGIPCISLFLVTILFFLPAIRSLSRHILTRVW